MISSKLEKNHRSSIKLQEVSKNFGGTLEQTIALNIKEKTKPSINEDEIDEEDEIQNYLSSEIEEFKNYRSDI